MTSESADADLAAATAALSIYGQKPQPEETSEFLSKSHLGLLEELDKLPDEKKAGWLQAKEKCPNLVGEEHRLMFLRCERFNVEVSKFNVIARVYDSIACVLINVAICVFQLAASRVGNYWNRRIELFGENRAFKPIHLGGDGALSSSSTLSSDDGETDKDDESMVQNTLKVHEISSAIYCTAMFLYCN